MVNRSKWAGVTALALAVAVLATRPTAGAAPGETRPGVQTNESLRTMLVNMGYDIEDVKSTRGKPMYKMDYKIEGWTIPVYVSLSETEQYVWLSASLMEVPGGDVGAPQMRKLLQKNFEFGPSHFVIKGKRLYLDAPLDNREVTPARLRKAIETLASNVKATEDLWDTRKWGPGNDQGKVDRRPSER